MEAILALVVLAIVALPVVALVAALIALQRAREVGRLRARLEQLEARVDTLLARLRRQEPAPAVAP
ncbi:MAG TPA: hypothetical protein VJS92_12515, partial [Candidatus Polarisedimenticolaceae bacterium]|nr:hypothetical protein [Candidatus Polarisedimenticolaceae bacterium]